MSIDRKLLASTVDAYIGDLDHPDAPGVPVREYAVHQRVAAMMKNPNPIDGGDVAQAYHMLKQLDMSPAEWEHAWKIARPLANRLLERDPDPSELALFKGFAHPGDIADYYSSHPHPKYPEVSAGDFARYYHAAEGIAIQAGMKRKPLGVEVARFAAAGYDPQSMFDHFTHKPERRLDVG